VDTAAGLTGKTLRNLRDQSRVFALAHCSIEIDKLNEWKLRELVDPVIKIVESKSQFLALNKLDDSPTKKVD